MIVKIVLLLVLCCVDKCYCSSRTKKQIPWYDFVNCFDTEGGVYCEPAKTVIAPYVHNYPLPLPWNQQNQQYPTDSSSLYERNAQATTQDKVIACGAEQFLCKSPHQCISKKYLCDGRVNCVDASDETNCTCTSRLDPSKICDGYHDCPDGSDEIRCFGCRNDLYSCHYNEAEYIANSRRSECYTEIDKCDGMEHCSNRKDETECLILASENSLSSNPFMRSTVGFLFMNFQNKWYPVCEDLGNWAREVCTHELRVQLSDEPISVYQAFTTYDGKYISGIEKGNKFSKKFVNHCSVAGIELANRILRVKCPDVCGSRIHLKTENMRIAGGKEAAPGSHPWIVSLHLNTQFICGGNIIGEKWILTAAHCLYREQKKVERSDYLEVRAGVLRQTSFSPQEQAIQVSRAIIYSAFEKKSLKGDIAVLELNVPLQFNSWVQPICLPTPERVSNKTDANWMWTLENNTCLTAGWGGLTGRGPAPVENLMEVELPIVRDCDPQNAVVFCAGYPEGGSDTCIGDSGGPIICRSSNHLTEFYLAGITSSDYNTNNNDQKLNHCGEPNTFTTFTKMSLFTMWIDDILEGDRSNEIVFLAKCPGVQCRSNNRCVRALDGIVDCLEGEDETY